MALPELPRDWTATRQALHQAAQIVGAVRAAVAPPQPNYLHLGLQVIPGRLTTGPLGAVGEWQLDLTSQTLRWYQAFKTPIALPVRGMTQRALANTVRELAAHAGYHLALDETRLSGDTPLEPDAAAAVAYGDALTALHTILEQVRASLPGPKTPLVVWPHGFDLSFLWFATGVESEEAPHMSFGFSPASEGLERPYLYAYAHPIPPGLTDLPLPAPARWHTVGWTGVVLPYDDVAPRQDAPEAIADIVRAVHAQVSPLLKSS